MPTIGTMRLPPPQDGVEFQDMALAALRRRWNSPELERHGRQGQAQQGVDLYGPDNLGRKIGVQCKAVKKLTIAEISDEITKAEHFEPAIAALYITTTLLTDATLQKEVRLLSEERLRKSKFPVGIIFWEAIKDEIAADRSVLQRFYPDLALVASSVSEPEGSRLLSALDIGFRGTTLRYRMSLVFGDFGMLTEDPHGFSRVTLQLEACGNVLLKEPTRSEFSRLNHDLLASTLRIALGTSSWLAITRAERRNSSLPELVLGQTSPGENWDEVWPLAIRIEAHVGALENMLHGEELAAYTCGCLLGSWDKLEDKNRKRTTSLITQILHAVDVLKHTAELKEVILTRAKEFEENKSLMSAFGPSLVYGAIRNFLLSRAFAK